jgi:hypothetical protein
VEVSYLFDCCVDGYIKTVKLFNYVGEEVLPIQW